MVSEDKNPTTREGTAPQSASGEDILEQQRRFEEAVFGLRFKSALVLGISGVVLACLGAMAFVFWLVNFVITLIAGGNAELWLLAVSGGCLLACAICHIVDAALYRKHSDEGPLSLGLRSGGEFCASGCSGEYPEDYISYW